MLGVRRNTLLVKNKFQSHLADLLRTLSALILSLAPSLVHVLHVADKRLGNPQSSPRPSPHFQGHDREGG